MKKRLTVVLTGFAVGGAEHMVYELVKNIDKSKYHISVLCCMPKQNHTLEQQVEAICPVTYVDDRGLRALKGCRILKAIFDQKPDIVHAHLGGSGYGAMWAILTKKRFLVTAHTKPEKAFDPRNEKLVRRALKNNNATLVAVSEENKLLLKSYFSVKENQIACVNNGVDLGRFCQKNHSGFTIINVARQDENKNQTALLRCFAKLYEQDKTAKLLLLGNGPLHEELKRQAEALNISQAVVFAGNVPNTEDYYAESDLYVQTSHREAMPLSVLEAMAAGLPIVSTNVGGLKDVVQDNGILVPDNDEEALYQAVWKIYKQGAEEAQKMSKASKQIVTAYSSENMARAYEKIYDEQ